VDLCIHRVECGLIDDAVFLEFLREVGDGVASLLLLDLVLGPVHAVQGIGHRVPMNR